LTKKQSSSSLWRSSEHKKDSASLLFRQDSSTTHYLKPAGGVALEPFQKRPAGEVARPISVLAVGVREEIVGFYGPSQPFLVLGLRVQGRVGVKHVDLGTGLTR